MRIALMTDLEGVAGVRNFDDWCNPDSRYYETGRRFLTEEVNAAIRGFFDAGADEIVVVDGHGAGAINIELLDERAELSRGWGVYHQFGLNDNFDALAFVGQHAKAGTVKSHLTHTGMPNTYDLQINGYLLALESWHYLELPQIYQNLLHNSRLRHVQKFHSR